MLKMNLKDLLKRALLVQAEEVRLVPGRRTIVVTQAGENEVRGDTQTPESIQAMLEPLLSAEARRALAAGWAQWQFDLPNHGTVQATAEIKMGLVHASFDLRKKEGARVLQAPAPAPASPAQPVSPQPVLPQQWGGGAREVPLAPRTPGLTPEPLSPTQPSMRKMGGEEPHAQTVQQGARGLESTERIERLLRLMVERNASDLHISTNAPPMLRLDGDMVPVQGEAPLQAEEVRKMLWAIVPERNRKEFEETSDTDFAYEIPQVARFRSNLFVDLYGMGGVFRQIPTKILTVEQLGLPTELLSLCSLPKGLVVVTGPTGSGKSTTLAALIDYINRTRKAHIITIEDPIEFVHKNQQSLINQRQVGEHTESFKKALRAALREDPDIVLLGEMRDLETISIAMETAETGHLVFGTLHTSSAPSTIDRIIDQFPTEQQNQVRTMLSVSLKGVIAQMLCKKKGGGRVAALEVMMGVPAIANLIREGKIFQIPSIMQTSRNIGMRMMNDSLIDLVKRGVVDSEEALAKSNDKATLQTMLRQANLAPAAGGAS